MCKIYTNTSKITKILQLFKSVNQKKKKKSCKIAHSKFKKEHTMKTRDLIANACSKVQNPKINKTFDKILHRNFGIALLSLSLLACLGSLSLANAQNFEDEIEREIQLLEKQKKLLELKRQNKQLSKELDSKSTSNGTKSPKAQKQSNTPYYPPYQSNPQTYNQNTQNAPYYPSNAPANNYDSTGDNKTYQDAYNQSYNNAYQHSNERKSQQTYFRLEGSYGIGYGEISPIADILNLSVKPSLWQGGFEFGTQNNDSSVRNIWLGVSYGEHNGKIVNNNLDLTLNGQYGTFYSGIDWVPTFGESPLRAVLGVYAAVFMVQYIDKGYIDKVEDQYTKFTWGVGAGFRVGLALDLGKHAQIEVGTRLGANIAFDMYNKVKGLYVEKTTFPYMYYVNGYGAITFLF